MDVRTFLNTVITCPEPGYFCLAISPKRGQGWVEEWYEWPAQIDTILERAKHCAEEHNVYFSTYLFSTRASSKEYVLPTRTIQADLDEAEVLVLSPVPTVLVETSPGRHQAYWIVREESYTTPNGEQQHTPIHPLDIHEVLSRKLTYSIPDCDHSGWALGRKVRLPETLNHKYLEGPRNVKVVQQGLRQYPLTEFELIPDVPQVVVEHFSEEFLNDPPLEYPIGPQELLNTYKAKLPTSVVTGYTARAKDRSKVLWSLELACFRAGLSREEAFWLAYNSANNKFKDLLQNGPRELAKDILRAEQVVKSKIPDEKAAISEARKLPGSSIDKKPHLLNLITQFMRASGDFIRTPDDNAYYVRHDLGRPIMITPRSDYLNMVLHLQFGLNVAEQDHAYVVNGLYAMTRGLPINGNAAALSWFDIDTNAVLLHLGKREVLRITAKSIEQTTNGSYGIVFPWEPSVEPFLPTYSSDRLDWGQLLFGSALDNLVGMEPDEARALLQVWMLFLLFRSAAISRPILALFGQPGSGKSTLFRRIYTVLYGRQKSLGAVTSADDFDHATSHYPLIVLDNVDTWEKWLPDRLALAASSSDITKRRLYTDTDAITLKRDALIGITAHNPRFGREDVADRLVLLTFERLGNFLPEGDIIADILSKRNQIWGAICLDVQRVLATPMPSHADVPQFRVEDFARLGAWIARALGLEVEFARGIRKMTRGTKSFNLEEDHLIVQAISSYITGCKRSGEWQTAGALWTDLVTHSGDQPSFMRTYRNAVSLSKKLWALQDSLKMVFDIEWKQEDGARHWRIHKGGAVNGKESASTDVSTSTNHGVVGAGSPSN